MRVQTAAELGWVDLNKLAHNTHAPFNIHNLSRGWEEAVGHSRAPLVAKKAESVLHTLGVQGVHASVVPPAWAI